MDIFRIEPKIAYSQADLNYNNSNCRANTEQNDSSARPEISSIIDNFDSYTTFFMGYPIWWGKAPKIIYTLLEKYDFPEKTIIPFCTSGGSSIEGSIPEIKALSPNANWLNGKRFSFSASTDKIKNWVSATITITNA